MLSTPFLAGALLVCSPAITDDNWVADFDTALAQAKKEKKDLFVDFTGSDWCGWCIRLHEEVFDHAEFLDAAKERFILVALDFPQGEEAKAKVPNAERNQELSQKHKVQGFPTILLMTADEHVYGQTGYREGGPEPYVEHLDELYKTGHEALAAIGTIVEGFKAAESEEAKLAAWEKAVAQLEKMSGGSPLAAALAPVARYAMVADPDNGKGLKLRAIKAMMDAGMADADLLAAARALDPKNENGLLEKAVAAELQGLAGPEQATAWVSTAAALLATGNTHDKETCVQIMATAVNICVQLTKDMEQAKKFGAKARELDPDNERLAAFLDQVLEG